VLTQPLPLQFGSSCTSTRPSVSNSMAPTDTGGALFSGVQVWPSDVATEPSTARNTREIAHTDESFLVTLTSPKSRLGFTFFDPNRRPAIVLVMSIRVNVKPSAHGQPASSPCPFARLYSLAGRGYNEVRQPRESGDWNGVWRIRPWRHQIEDRVLQHTL